MRGLSTSGPMENGDCGMSVAGCMTSNSEMTKEPRFDGAFLCLGLPLLRLAPTPPEIASPRGFESHSFLPLFSLYGSAATVKATRAFA